MNEKTHVHPWHGAWHIVSAQKTLTIMIGIIVGCITWHAELPQPGVEPAPYYNCPELRNTGVSQGPEVSEWCREPVRSAQSC